MSQLRAFKSAYESNRELFQQADQEMQSLLTRAAVDTEFRQELLTQPREAVSRFTGRALPESWNVVFIESAGGPTVVLPDPIDTDAEIQEEDLMTVAGGVTSSPACSVIATVALTLWAWDEFVERD